MSTGCCDGRGPSFSYSTDGAEMGKLMVAEGLGATVLPDFSVIGDPLERQGTITYRPIADDTTRVLLMLQRRRAESVPRAAQNLYEVFVRTGTGGGRSARLTRLADRPSRPVSPRRPGPPRGTRPT